MLVEAKPMVVAYEEFLSHDEAEHSWKVAADMLRDHAVGRNRLLKILREEGVLIDGGINHNTPYRKYIEAGYFRIKLDSQYPDTPVTLTTEKGVAFLSSLRAEIRERVPAAKPAHNLPPAHPSQPPMFPARAVA